MQEKTDYRGMVNPVPNFPEAEQREIIAKFKPSEIYTISKHVSHDDIIAQQRTPRAVVVAHVALAAVQKGKKARRLASLVEFVEAIHGHGSFVVDASTGQRSNKPKDWIAMYEAAGPVLGRISQGSKSALNGRRGSQPYEFTDRQIGIMLIAVTPGRHKNFPERRQAIASAAKMPISKVPNRTWLLTKLTAVARARGLIA